MIPDKAQNNQYDVAAAEYVYRELQRENIPMTIVTRWAAYAAKIPLSIFDRMAKTCHPVTARTMR